MSKYILVTSGVCSSLGKGVATASIGSLLECSGLNVAMVKCDPYINIDAGTISPYQHGEVYVTEDGAETDADLGTYARFTNVRVTESDCVTIGKVYATVIHNERAGRYNGRAVQVIPHITDEIKRRIVQAGTRTGADVVIVEIGGTVGDIESIPFLEAARQFSHEQGRGNCITVHLTLVPTIIGGELKTKPTQHSVKQLQERGIQPDILLCRCERSIDDEMRKKIAMFCNVSLGSVFASTDIDASIYELPVLFHQQGIAAAILKKLGMDDRNVDVAPWTDFLAKLQKTEKTVTVAMVGKKDYLDDCYKSVQESLFHAATAHGARLRLQKIDAEVLESCTDVAPHFTGVDAIIIPGNYGQRGFLGLLATVRYAREQYVPYFGIDLGMQLMAIETARSLLGWSDADSTEFMQNSQHAVISLPEEQSGSVAVGVVKLGVLPVAIEKGTKLHDVYQTDLVRERHRSKYTFDRRYTDDMAAQGLVIAATAADDRQAEAFEWQRHPWGIGVQFHPEFVSRPTTPHPLFSAFIGAALSQKK